MSERILGIRPSLLLETHTFRTLVVRVVTQKGMLRDLARLPERVHISRGEMRILYPGMRVTRREDRGLSI